MLIIKITEMERNTKITYLLLGALLALAGNIINSCYQGYQNRRLEKIQFESTLILNSIDKNDIESSKKNIKFLLESKLISLKNEKILSMLTDSTFVIKLPEIDTITLKPLNKFKVGSTFIKSVYSGQVLDRSDKPIENVEITTKRYPPYKFQKEFYAKTYSDKNGLFEIPIPDGMRYFISFEKEGYSSWNNAAMARNIPLPEKISLRKFDN